VSARPASLLPHSDPRKVHDEGNLKLAHDVPAFLPLVQVDQLGLLEERLARQLGDELADVDVGGRDAVQAQADPGLERPAALGILLGTGGDAAAGLPEPAGASSSPASDSATPCRAA
jgi:hypothetical protein